MRIRRAFETGEVFWTKLRLVAKVATAESEAEWLRLAAELSSRELEEKIAAAKGDEAPRIKVVFELTSEQYADLDDAMKALRRERDEAMPVLRAAHPPCACEGVQVGSDTV